MACSVTSNPLIINIPTHIIRNFLDHPFVKILSSPSIFDSTDGRSFSEKIQEIKEKSDEDIEINGKDGWLKELTITLPGQPAFSVFLVLSSGHFKSSTFYESYFVGEGNEDQKKYYYIELFKTSNINSEKSFLTIRIDQSGEFAELTNIEKSDHFSGNQLKEIAEKIFQYLGVRVVHLYDAAGRVLEVSKKFWIRKKLKELPELRLKEFLAVASDDRMTWYEKNGYRLAEFTKVKTFQPEVGEPAIVTQSARCYHIALEALRNTTIADVYDKIFTFESKAREATKYLFEKYLKKLSASSKQESEDGFGNATVHDLGKALLEANRKAVSIETNEDLFEFHQYFLVNYEYRRRISKELSDFNLMIEILRRHFIWYKDFKNPDAQTTLQRFLQEPPGSLEEILCGMKKPTGVRWDDIVLRKESLKRPSDPIENKLEPLKKKTKKGLK